MQTSGLLRQLASSVKKIGRKDKTQILSLPISQKKWVDNL